MTVVINETNALAAWLAGCHHLIGCRGEDYNVLISYPCHAPGDESPLRDFDPRTLLGAEFDVARDVANTIFPSKTLANARNRVDFYSRYARAHGRRRRRTWGTYFHRLTDFGVSHVNQLENVIRALLGWTNNPRAALIMHTSSSETDSLKPLGSPCLQFLQVNCPDGNQAHLVAVFRNHDFSNKVLGNYYGLARLLAFVAGETEREAGLVTCLSIHAYFEASLRQQRHLMGLT